VVALVPVVLLVARIRLDRDHYAPSCPLATPDGILTARRNEH
jgi:hypothetical protein